MRAKLIILSVAVASFLPPITEGAAIGQNSTPSGSAMSGACAGTSVGGAAGTGRIPNDGVTDASQNCQIATATAGNLASSSASKSGSANGNPYTGSATGVAGVGTLKLGADTTGSSGSSFSGGQVTVGWNDSFTLTGGSGNGVWLVPIAMDGTIASAGQGALGRVEVAVYKNGSPITSGSSSQAYNLFTTLNPITHHGAIFYGWDNERIAWGTADYGAGSPLTTLNISTNEVVWFALPFTWGTPFQAGFWATAIAGQIASGGSVVQNGTSLDFTHTITWGGQGYVVNANNSVVNSFTIGSTSGFNYYDAVTPEPGTWATGLAGTALIGLAISRRRKQA